jgi:transposase-like protein
MTDDRMALVELLQKSGESDFLRAVAEAVLQILMEADVEGLIGAGRHERSADRLNYRNGYRERSLDTRLGSLQLRIPKLRQGSYFPPFLEPRKTAEKALVTVIQEAWIGGVSTRRVDELVQAMGLSGISKSQVSKLCKDIDERVNAFLDRPLDGEGERGETLIESRGVAHRIVFAVDRIRQEPRIERTKGPSLIKSGTSVTVHWPNSA